MDQSTEDISSRSSVLITEYSLQHKRKWSLVSVSRPHFHIVSTISLKPCLNLCSFKWLKFNFRRVNSLRPFVSCIAKTEFSLGLTKLKIISLNFQEWHFDTQKALSTSFKFLKKDCAFVLIQNKIAFFSLSLPTIFVSHLYDHAFTEKQKLYATNNNLDIYIYIYVYIYIYIYIYQKYQTLVDSIQLH